MFVGAIVYVIVVILQKHMEENKYNTNTPPTDYSPRNVNSKEFSILTLLEQFIHKHFPIMEFYLDCRKSNVRHFGGLERQRGEGIVAR